MLASVLDSLVVHDEVEVDDHVVFVSVHRIVNRPFNLVGCSSGELQKWYHQIIIEETKPIFVELHLTLVQPVFREEGELVIHS